MNRGTILAPLLLPFGEELQPFQRSFRWETLEKPYPFLKVPLLLGEGQDVIQNQLNEILGNFKDLQEKLGHLASSVQYESPCFGTWLRFRFIKDPRYIPGTPESKLSQAEGDYYEELHQLMPKQSNLLFTDDLMFDVIVKFGGTETKIRKLNEA